jgi:hypothetical protein
VQAECDENWAIALTHLGALADAQTGRNETAGDERGYIIDNCTRKFSIPQISRAFEEPVKLKKTSLNQYVGTSECHILGPLTRWRAQRLGCRLPVRALARIVTSTQKIAACGTQGEQ